MKNYHFSCGNSTTGMLGLCAEVAAETQKEAIQKLRTILHDTLGFSEALPVQSEGSSVKYINIYVNPDYIGGCQIEEREERNPIPQHRTHSR